MNLKDNSFYRADLILHGIDPSGISYEGRIFFNHPDANPDTPTTLENGYAGSFSIFGHGGCYGNVGHCTPRTGMRSFDKRPKSPVESRDIPVIVTDALKQVLLNSQELEVTIVPIVRPENADFIKQIQPDVDTEHCLKFDKFEIALYDAPQSSA
ncbi:MAG: hypothetical protein HC936_10420 [Leptolyngbyaceae cyanobacterium SU_3_3]|nr:hypothetical protein [Leptolyngbyaceae cyanobacterium SU_3_3]